MTGLDLRQVRTYIVAPALIAIGLHSRAEEQIVMMTGMAESGFHFIDQVTRGQDVSGPALGPFQMETASHDDLWENYLRYQPELSARVSSLLIDHLPHALQMQGNLYYAAAMCRVFYRRVRAPLPKADDFEGMARYWKRHYNTPLGRGTVDGFLQKTQPVMALYRD